MPAIVRTILTRMRSMGGTYGVLGLDEGIVDSDNVDVIVLDAENVR